MAMGSADIVLYVGHGKHGKHGQKSFLFAGARSAPGKDNVRAFRVFRGHHRISRGHYKAKANRIDSTLGSLNT